MDESTCLQGTGITPEVVRAPDGLIERQQEMRLFENLVLALPELPALGYKLGARFRVNAFGTWGFAAATSRNLKEAMERALRFLPLSTAYCQYRIRERADELHLQVDADAIPAPLRQTLLERDISTSIVLLRDWNLQGTVIRRLLLRGPAPDYSDEISRVTGLKPEFNAGENALVIAMSDALRPLPTYDARMVEVLESQCRQLMQRRQAEGTAGKVRDLLLARDGLTRSLEDVAAELCLSPRSLRRRLDAEDCSFRQLQEETRQQLARQLLSVSTMKLDEVAYHLGYADTSSFTRSFRRWESLSPGEFRKQQAEREKAQ